MAYPAPESSQYYIGINGQQSGPHSESEIVEKLRSGQIPTDAVVWQEGMESWVPIQSVPAFQTSAMTQLPMVESVLPPPPGASPLPLPPVTPTTPPAPVRSTALPEMGNEEPTAAPSPRSPRANVNRRTVGAPPGGGVRPVFSRRESTIGRPSILTTRLFLTIFFVILLMGAGYGLFYWQAQNVMDAQFQGGVKTKVKLTETRTQRVRKALSELMIKPRETLPILEKIVEENPDDKAGQEALDSAIEYYRRNRRNSSAGTLLMTAKRPLEAADFFLGDPPDYERAEIALYRAYETGKTAEEKQKLLLRDIELLLGPLNNQSTRATAVGRIKKFSEEFPNAQHPFGYYLKSPEARISEMFSRVAFHFVEGIERHLETDFPDIRLAGRPLVELKKTAKGEYRIQATYKGDVALGRDKLPNITLTFWHWQEKWFLVETNLTEERGRWAGQIKQKMTEAVWKEPEMLEVLETIHTTRFPKATLHGPPPKAETAKKDAP